MALKDLVSKAGLARMAINTVGHLPPGLRIGLWQKMNALFFEWVDAYPHPALEQVADANAASGKLVSSTCRQAEFHSPIYHEWCKRMATLARFHRKQWEFYFIARALEERGMLANKKLGLGFGVGKEPLASVFAREGCELLLTDMDVEEAKERGWASTNQHAAHVKDLNLPYICPQELFLERVRFEIADMNHIPEQFRNFDFCWSSCALEHLGSIESGLRFIERALDCLKPGGYAVHTTEFNVCSNDETLDHASTVLFRRRDLEELQRRLSEAGHSMEPLALDFGELPMDGYIDMPPYKREKHLKLALSRWVTTSVGIIIQKNPV